MQQDTPDSASAAERRMNAPRPRLVTLPGLIGLAITVSVVLALLYPQRFLLEQIRSSGKVDEVSLQYMRNLLATEPGNHSLRLKLARDYAMLGRFEEALELLQPLYALPEWREAAIVEQIDILEKMLWQAKPGSPEREKKLNLLRKALHGNEDRIFSADALRKFADAAGYAGETGLVQQTVKRLVQINPDQANLDLAAKVTEETGQYLDSAGYQWRACQLLSTPSAKTACILQTIRILQAGGLGKQGLQWIRLLPANEWSHPDVLYSLTRLAMASNLPAEADGFAAMLMAQSSGSVAAYAPAHFELAYTAFLGNRDLPRAFDAARIAVEQEPDSPVWRERLAQVAEWTNQPEIAMAQWRWLALHQGKESAWQSWMRLAGGLFDYAAQITGLQHMSHENDDRYARRIVKLYEDLGQPEGALAWLKTQGDLARHPDLLLLRAEVLMHLGRDAEAISTYRQYLKQNVASPDLAVRISGMMMRAGLYREAFDVLKKSRAQAKPKDQSFWLNLGELAWQQKNDDEVIAAYRVLSDSPDAELFERQRLFMAIKHGNPKLAAQTAERYWLKSAQIELFMDAASTYAELNDWREVKRLYERAEALNLREYRRNFQYVSLRAEMHQHQGNLAAAVQDREFLVRHFPASAGAKESLLWLLLDTHQSGRLEYYLHKWTRLIGRTPSLWDVYAAGQLALGNTDGALMVYRRTVKSHEKDDLWMLNYADALEAAGQKDSAWKIRRQIWQQRFARKSAWRNIQAHDIEALRLLLLDEPALGQGVLWKLLRENTPALKQNTQFIELATAWLNDHDQNDAMHRWLLHRYANWLNTPLGVRISDALARHDREAAQEILGQEAIPANDRMNLSYLAERYNDAAELAFGAMDRARHDESMYEQAAPMLLHNDHTLGAMTAFRNLYDYKEMERSINTTGQRIGGLKLDLSLHQTSRFGANPAILAYAPNETGGEISLHQIGSAYVNTLTLKLSQSLNTQAGILFSQMRQIGSRLRLKIEMAYNDVANETPLMRLIGRRNQIALQSNYRIDDRNELETRGELNQYHSIDQQHMGSGQSFSTTLTHHLSDAHPALQGIVNGTWSTFQAAGTLLSGRTASLIPPGQPNNPGYFLPQNIHEISTYAHVGDMIDSSLPARDFEYMGEVGRYYDTVYGGGWRMNAGIAGRVIGADRLQVFLRYDQGAYRQGANEQFVPTLEAGVVYTLHY